MKTSMIAALGFICLLHGAAAVAADEGAAKPAAAPAAAGAAGEAKKIDWKNMKFAERKKYMKSTVLPEMQKLFADFDAKKYKKITCETCHGTKAVDTKFKMPNPQLPKLPQPTDRAGFMALQQKKPEVAKFMGTKVKPTMASLLGMQEWTPANPDGFGCYGCHTKEEAKEAAPAPAAK
jgi:hypothetical protein